MEGMRRGERKCMQILNDHKEEKITGT